MSMFSSSGNRIKTAEEKDMELEREKARERADRTSEHESELAQSAAMGRLMGKRGSRAFFTGTGAGYSRTLGSSNVVTIAA